MAEKLAENKMAVTSNFQNLNQPSTSKGGNVRDDGLDNSSQNISKVGAENVPKKKSTFKITNITKGSTADADGDSIGDDLDESHTDDFTSDLLDSSKASDLDQDILTPDEVVCRDKPDPQSRFRVVKIESKEPFRRGRWLCYDFLDAPSFMDRNEPKPHLHEEHPTGSTMTSSGHFSHGFDDSLRNIPSSSVNMSGTSVDGVAYLHQNGPVPQASHQQNVTGIERQSDVVTSMNQYPCPVPQPYVTGQIAGPLVGHQGQPGHVMVAPQNMPMPNLPVNAHVLPHMQQTVSMPHNIHPLPGMSQGQTGIHMQPSVLGTQPTMSQPYPVTPQTFQPPLTQVGLIHGTMMSQIMTTAMDHASYSQPGAHMQTVYTNQLDPRMTIGMVGTISVPLDSIEAKKHLPAGMVSNDLTIKENIRPDTLHLSEKTVDDGNNLLIQPAMLPQLTPALVAAVGVPVTPTNEQIDSGSNTVAIDNKIEQAMDLVKSHLMFAVREEVEVLKEQIKDLTDHINTLERENAFLRANVPSEVLTQLSQPSRSLNPSSS